MATEQNPEQQPEPQPQPQQQPQQQPQSEQQSESEETGDDGDPLTLAEDQERRIKRAEEQLEADEAES